MELFVSMQEAARLEGISYAAFRQVCSRNRDKFQRIKEIDKSTNRPYILVSVVSLSPSAQRRYRKEHPEALVEEVQARALEGKEDDTGPWYAEMTKQEFEKFMEANREQFDRATAEMEVIEGYLAYEGPDKTGFALKQANKLGWKQATFFKKVRAVREAKEIAHKREEKDGCGYPFLPILALCRKPTPRNTFPSLSEEQRRIIMAVYWNREYRTNHTSGAALYERAAEEMKRRGMAWIPNQRMVERYVAFLKTDPVNRQAWEYQSMSAREWENHCQIKGRNDTTQALYMEHLQGDTHTLDFWSEVVSPNGRRIAARLQLVSWIDVRTRRIVGYELCTNSNSEIITRSLLSVIYNCDHGGVPRMLHIDNGKDYTAEWVTGQKRRDKHIDQGGSQGVYKQLGIERYQCSIAFQPWSKGIVERFFLTARQKMSEMQLSYTGTLTGSRTEDKISKDIQGMLKRGQLPTMEQTYEIIKAAVEDYNDRPHDGLKDQGEEYVTPNSLMNHCEHYSKAPIPIEIAMLLALRPATASVTNQGIHRFNQIYSGNGLEAYVGQKVNIRYNSWDRDKLLVTDQQTHKIICTAEPLQAMIYGVLDDPAMIAGQKRKNRNKTTVRNAARFLTEEKVSVAPSPRSISSADLADARPGKLVALSNDPEVRAMMQSREKSNKEYWLNVPMDDSEDFFRLAEGSAVK